MQFYAEKHIFSAFMHFFLPVGTVIAALGKTWARVCAKLKILP